MGKTYLAFDFGASSGRGILGRIENDKLMISEIHRFLNNPLKKDGSLFWNFDFLFSEMKTGLKKAADCCDEISGIGIDTWGVDYLLLGENGNFVRQPYHYRDSRTDNIPVKVFSIIPIQEIYQRTGIQYMQLNSIYQLFAHKENHPEDLEDSVFLMMPDALTYMLSGKVACEYTEASTSQLINPSTKQWDFELIKRIGLPETLFPKIVKPCTKAGILKAELQSSLPCKKNITVYHIGSHDTASAVASIPASSDANWAYISCGTWSLLGTELDSPFLADEARKANYTNEGGLNKKIRFLTNIMGLWLLQECRRIWEEQGKTISYTEMAKAAEKVKPMRFLINPNNQIFFAPGDMPERIRDYCLRSGQEKIGDDVSIIRCVIDSLALCFRSKLEELQNLLGVKYDRLHVVGGGCQNDLLMRITADCVGIPVIAGPVEATAIGNLTAQAIAAGDIPSLDKGRQLVKTSFPVKTYSPDSRNKGYIEKAYSRFKILP